MIHSRRIDLNLLRTLAVIHAEGGVTRAAVRLNLSQSAISHALGRLRDLLGDPLFVRDGQRLIATPFTRGLVQPLDAALGSLDALVADASGFDPTRSTAQYAISMRDPTETLLLPRLFKQMAKGAPGVGLRTTQARRRSLENSLANGTVDLAIDVPLPLADSIRRRRLTAGKLVAVARRGHPALREGLTMRSYLALDHVMVTARRRGPGLEDLELSERGLRRRVRLRCRNYLAALRVVAATDLIMTITEDYGRTLTTGLPVQLLPLPFRTSTLDALLYWHQSVDDDAGNAWLRSLIIDAFRQAVPKG